MNPCITTYRDAVKALEEFKEKQFPKGTKVTVNSSLYIGPAKVVIEEGCETDFVAVRIPQPTGLVVRFPLEVVTPITT